MDWTNYLFSFNGRINRAKWWMFLLVCIGYVVAIWVVTFALLQVSLGAVAIWGIITLIGYVVLIYSSLAVGAKRLHDRNKGAIWLLVFYGIPMVIGGYYAYSMYGAMGAAMGAADQQAATMNMMQAMQGLWWLQLIDLVIGIWGLVELGILKGTTGDNQYGPDPLAGVAH